MSLNISETAQMANDVEAIRAELEQAYATGGGAMPDGARLLEQARCAWAYMTIRGVLQQEKDAAMAARRAAQEERMKKPPIILPGGRLR